MHQPHLEIKLAEIEKERDFLLAKITALEKSNKELICYKKELEQTLKDIIKEEDIDKKLAMVDLKIIRKRSLKRLDNNKVYKDSASDSDDNSKFNGAKPVSFMG